MTMTAISGMTPARIILGVSDLDASEHFYATVLGFEVHRHGTALTVTFGDFALVLESAPPAERAKFSIGFRIADDKLDELAARVQAQGGRILAGPDAHERGGRALLLMDPDHYQLEIHGV
jgi:catechol 2,3-dioxygenase-like lactoylglutathione lyase family enzyme